MHARMLCRFTMSFVCGVILPLFPLVLWGQTTPANLPTAVTVRHAPALNGGGVIDGSLQLLSPESMTINGGFLMTGDLLVPGSPALRMNGKPDFSGILSGSGSAIPSGYRVTLNGNCSLNHLRDRTDPVALPTVEPPPIPLGTRDVVLSGPNESIGDAASLRNVTLNGNAGRVVLPPGTYGALVANAGSGFILGNATAAQPEVYNFQSLTLNGQSRIEVLGPVIVTCATGFAANGTLGNSNSPSHLQLRIAAGGVNLNGGCTVHGTISAPAGTVVVGGHSLIEGMVQCDRLVVNGGGTIRGAAAPNHPPAALDQDLTTPEDAALDLLLAGTDPDSVFLTYTLLTAPAHGVLNEQVGVLTGSPLTYTPATNFNGIDSFTFKVNDGRVDSAVATVRITVMPVNDPPVAEAAVVVIDEDNPASITLGAIDVDGDALVFLVTIPPKNGILSGTPPNLVYLPATNFNGIDAFTFVANDGQTNSAVATVSITINPVNDAPILASIDDQSIGEETEFKIDLAAAAIDVDTASEELRFGLENGPPGMSIDPVLGEVRWTPTEREGPGIFAVTVSVSDNGTPPLMSAESFTISVEEVNRRPVLDALGDCRVLSGETLALRATASDPDEPANALTFSLTGAPAGMAIDFSSGDIRWTPSEAQCPSVHTVTVTVTDNCEPALTDWRSFTITAERPNAAPIVEAGRNQTNNVLTALLNGAIADDAVPAGALLTALWTKVSGPGEVAFSDATAPTNIATFSRSGTYVLRLTASDGLLESSDEVAILANVPPNVEAGSDFAVTVGETVQLSGDVADDGIPWPDALTFQWTLVEPGLVQIDDPTNAVTKARFLEIGTYKLRLTACDLLSTNSDEVTVLVLPVNLAPVISTGPRQLVVLPEPATLRATVADDDLPLGATLSFAWSKMSGPGQVVFSQIGVTTHAESSNIILEASATFSEAGDYVLRLSANDSALIGYGEVKVTVRTPAMNEAPVVSAGPDLVIGLTNRARLMGSVLDDGLPLQAPLSAYWSKVSGPGSVTFSMAASQFENSTSRIQVPSEALFSEAGIYVIRLTAGDSELSASDEVVVAVYPFNQPPLVDAGPDQTITLPDPSVMMPTGATPIDATCDLSVSLSDQAHWDYSIGQPGVSGIPAGGFLWVARNGLAVDGGNLVVAGGFTNAGGLWSKSLARFNGTSWSNFYDTNRLPHATGPGHDGTDPGDLVGWLVYDCGSNPYCSEIFDCSAVRGEEVFVGGFFKEIGDPDGLKDGSARWDGNRWQSWVFKTSGVDIYVIKATADKVYVGGGFAFQPTNATSQSLTNLPWSYAIATWDGTNWGALGSGIVDIRDYHPYGNPPGLNYTYARVVCMDVAPNGDVYVGGSFTMATPLGYATNVAMWSVQRQQWQPLGSGLQGNLFTYGSGMALAENGDLYVGGEITRAGEVPVHNVARWDGTRWWPLGTGTAEGVSGNVSTLVTYGRDVYVGGSFSTAGGVRAWGFAKWDGQFWRKPGKSGVDGFSGTVCALTVDDSGVYAGGMFDYVDGVRVGKLVKWAFPRAPERIAHLNGRVVDDGLPAGASLSAVWTKAGGPGDVTFENAANPVTTAAFSQPGTYVLRLTANDSEFTVLDEATIVVRGNLPPAVDAGQDQVIGIHQSAALAGAIADDGLPEGQDLVCAWSAYSGPGTVSFDNPSSTNTTAHFGAAGTYELRLSVNDSQFTRFDDLIVTVLDSGHANDAPSGTPGGNQVAVFGSELTLTAASLYDDGLPNHVTNILWTQISGPGLVAFSNPTGIVTTVSFSAPGAYVLRLNLNDSELASYRDCTVTVNMPLSNIAPRVNAGPGQTLTEGLTTLLQGQVTDDGLPPGAPLNCAWSVSSGPGTVTFANPNMPVTWASFSKGGYYVLRLTGSDTYYSSSATVAINIPNQKPVVCAGPDRTIVLPANSIELTARVSDDGQPGSALYYYWSKNSGPGTVTFSNPNALTTTVSFSVSGLYVLRFYAYDGSAISDSDYVTVIVAPPGNEPPTITTGTGMAIDWPGNSLILAGTITDDGLPSGGAWAQWSKVTGPGNVTFSPSEMTNGTTELSRLDATTTATFGEPGAYVLRLTGSDGVLTNAVDVIVEVRQLINQSPVADAGEDQTIVVTNSALLNGAITDDGLPFGFPVCAAWRKVSGPGPVYFGGGATNFTTNLITSARFIAPGNYVLRLVATDAATSASDDVVITVTPEDPNQRPIVSAGPDMILWQYAHSSLQGMVYDDGLPYGFTAVSWSRISGPGEAYFGDAGSADSDVMFYLTGTYVLRLAATDGRTTAYDDVTITVVAPANDPPLVVADGGRIVTRPNSAPLNGMIFDDGFPAGYPLMYQWSKVSGPGDVTFCIGNDTRVDATHWENAVSFRTPASASFSVAGTYVLQVSVTDSEFTCTDVMAITVLPGTNSPPLVDAGPDFGTSLGDETKLVTDVFDDGLENGWMEISWSQVSGPGTACFYSINGAYFAVFTAPGEYVLRLNADDGGLSASDEVTVTVYDLPGPMAQIANPLEDAIITCPSNIVGTASSPILASYVLEYRLAGDVNVPVSSGGLHAETPWTVLTSNTVSVVSNVLGQLDPTLALNGIYEIRLTATDLAGRSATTDPITVILDGNLKMGHFNISFTDLSVPVPGLPLRITRTYDSRAAAAGMQGDFGIGWTLDIASIRLQKNRSLSRNWIEYTTGGSSGLSIAYHLDPVRERIVTITFPDGRVEKFRFEPSPMNQALVPINYPQWKFAPIGNTRGSLVPAGYDEPDGRFLYFPDAVPGTGGLYDLNFYFETVGNFEGGPEDPEQLDRYPTLFRYTSPEGYRYLIDEIEGLQCVTDPNGNTLLVSSNGLTWANPRAGTNTLAIAFQRNERGCITNIVDAGGFSMSYAYSGDGNLVSFTDRDGRTNGFAYANPLFTHHLTGLIDSRGIHALQNEYDGEGRLVAAFDARGNPTFYHNDLSARRQVSTNRLGFVTTSEFDERGRLVVKTDAAGLVTSYSYDQFDNLISVSNAACSCASRFAYDSMDRLVSQTDELGRTIRYTYDSLGRVLTFTDADGNSSTNTYDAFGNLVSTRDPLGSCTQFAYNNQGRVTSMVDPRGGVTSFGYDAFGRLTSETNALGEVVRYTVDANGYRTGTSRLRTLTPGHQKQALSKIRKSGDVSDGNVGTSFKNVTFTYCYDNSGRLVSMLLPDNSSISNRFDEMGQLSEAIDQLGQRTSVKYNELGLPQEVTFPDTTSERMEYDAGGQITDHFDRSGRRTQFAYDPVGRLAHVTYPDGRTVTATYDLRGQLTSETDSCHGTTTYSYDAVGNRLSATDPLGHTTSYSYNSKRACTSITDPLGRVTLLEYDPLNRNKRIVRPTGESRSAEYVGRMVTSVVDEQGQAQSFGYDLLGRMVSATNALGDVTRFQYDELGNRVAETDAKGETTLHEFDDLGRRTKTISPDGAERRFTLDALGRLRTTVDPAGSSTGFDYDSRNNLAAITNGLGFVTRFEYNAAGDRTSRLDPDGRSVEWHYDQFGRLSGTTYRDGSSDAIEYDACNRIAAIIDRAGGRTSYAYDVLDRVVGVTDPSKGSTGFGYDAAGNLTSQQDPAGNITQFLFDTLNRQTGVVLPDGTSIGWDYDPQGRIAAQRDALGNTTTFAYDRAGRITAVTNAMGGVIGLAYDALGQLAARTDELGGITSYTYDPNGRLIGVLFPDGSTESAAYDSRGYLVARIDALGRPASYGYDELGRLTSVTNALGYVTRFSHDWQGQVTSVTDANGRITRFELDAGGNRTRMIYPDGVTESAGFDLAGRCISTTDANGNTTFYGYDVAGRLFSVTNALGQATTFAYDALGRRIEIVDPIGRTNRFEYDPMGRLTRVAHSDGTSSTRLYDAAGRQIATIDEAGITNWFGYDFLGRLVSVTNALGGVTSYEYDAAGRLVSQTDANGHATRYDYDAMGRRIRRTLPGGESEVLSYDLAGNLSSRTDFNGHTTSIEWDELNRPSCVVPDPLLGEPPVVWAYDAVGLRTNMVDAAGSTMYRHDSRNRLVEKARSWVDSSTSASLRYLYDAAGNVTNVSSSSVNGAALGYAYDALNRLAAVDDPLNGLTAYAYNAAGELSALSRPNGLQHAFTWDAGGRLSTLTTSGRGGELLSHFACDYAPAGNRTGSTELLIANGETNLLIRTYGYDAGYRLTNEVIAGTRINGSIEYTYDPVGNRLTRTSTVPGLADQRFDYDGNDQLTSDHYDANGNTLLGRLSAEMTPVADVYDHADRIVSRDNGRIRIAYDGDGNRVARTVGAVTTHFLVDENNPTGWPQVFEEQTWIPQDPLFASPAVTRVYAYGHAPLSQDQLTGDSWTASHFGQDAHGNVRYLTDLAGRVTDTMDYDAFGGMLARTGSTSTERLFTGEEFDSDLGLYNLRGRYHNPDSGRFWTRDSYEGELSDPFSRQLFAYVRNDPANRVDPGGHMFLTESMAVTALAPDVRGMVNQIFGGLNHYLYGIAGGAAADTSGLGLLANDSIQAQFIQGLSQHAGINIGRDNFFAAMNGAPFLLAANPNVYRPRTDCWRHEVIGFDPDQPIYGCPNRHPMFTFDYSNDPMFRFASGLADLKGAAVGFGRGVADFAVGAFDLAKSVVGTAAYISLSGIAPDAANTLFYSEADALVQTVTGLGQIGWDAANGVAYKAFAPFNEAYAEYAFGENVERLNLVMLKMTGGDDIGAAERTTYTLTQIFIPGAVAKAAKAAHLQVLARSRKASDAAKAARMESVLVKEANAERAALESLRATERLANSKLDDIADASRTVTQDLAPGQPCVRPPTAVVGTKPVYAYDMVNNPGPLARMRGTPAQGFAGGRYNAIVLDEDLILYRGGMAGGGPNAYGQWFTRSRPKSAAQVHIESAVKRHWVDSKTGIWTGESPIESVYELKIPKGTTIYEGPTSTQGGIYLGGSDQIFIPEPRNIPGVQVISEMPLP